MIDDLRALAVFSRTVDTGSFRAAARELGLSPSVVSHHVSQLSITMPGFLARSALVGDLAAFAQAYPKVELAVNFTDEKRDLIRDGIDLAIRVGALKDSALKSKKLSILTRKLVAAPAYIAAQKKPRQPSDLDAWEWNRAMTVASTGCG